MPRIFISYRRTDSPAHAGRLYDRLVDKFGEGSVFKDLDSMDLGDDFVDVIQSTIARCDVVLAVIGAAWVTSRHDGRRRLDEPGDWVRTEILEALRGSARVIPV